MESQEPIKIKVLGPDDSCYEYVNSINRSSIGIDPLEIVTIIPKNKSVKIALHFPELGLALVVPDNFAIRTHAIILSRTLKINIYKQFFQRVLFEVNNG